MFKAFLQRCQISSTLCLWAVLLLASIGSYAQKNSSLAAHYKFNKDYLDQTPNKNNGSFNGGFTFTEDRFGNECSALGLDGNSFLSVPSSASLSSPSRELTIAAWIKSGISATTDPSLMWFTVCVKGNQPTETDDTPHYRLQMTSKTISINTGFTEYFDYYINPDTWYHCAITYDGSTVKLYMNGEEVFQYPYYGVLQPNNQPLEIGRDIPGDTEFQYGAVDDLYIYSKALNARQIYNLYDDNTEINGNGVVCSVPNSNTTTNTQPVLVQKTDTAYVTDTVYVRNTVRIPQYDTLYDTQVIRQVIYDTIPVVRTLEQVDTVYNTSVVRVDRQDTVFVDKVDTVYNTSVVRVDKQDTVFINKTDTVFINKVDTIYEQQQVYVPPQGLDLDQDNIILRNVYFVQSQPTLLSSSFDELDELVEILAGNENIQIKLTGHTDNVGNRRKNLELSKQRVIEVKKYLISKGIDGNRISLEAFGQTRPLNDNSTEELRKQNRRVEVVVTKR